MKILKQLNSLIKRFRIQFADLVLVLIKPFRELTDRSVLKPDRDFI